MGIFTSKSEKLEKSKSFLNKAIIGLGFGIIKTRELILNDATDTQSATDALSMWIGRELMKEMLEQKLVKVSDSEEKLIGELMKVINLAEELDLNVEENKLKVVVQKCHICPKRVGGYDLENNTACPVGGILTGAIAYARGSDPIVSKNHLQTGEICHIEMDL
ncbi:hypothetical protein DSAG12_03938 [Promethearchaeum syntrophicum]|uniref:Metanogen output domain-containing protein n=1 Tax=Promethearchaeum syntrophicum TaxID=2594042 RepID=A0A5B9DH72_9ARCH|nr:hypothetical protein [Candidatus Prometheoarchaeum syntrophicum]